MNVGERERESKAKRNEIITHIYNDNTTKNKVRLYLIWKIDNERERDKERVKQNRVKSLHVHIMIILLKIKSDSTL